MNKKTQSISGTRTEAIKMAPLWRALAAKPGAESVVCRNGHHWARLDRSMPRRVHALFGLAPNDGFAVMTKNRTLNSRSVCAIEVADERPDWLNDFERPGRHPVHGDTPIASGALAAVIHPRIVDFISDIATQPAPSNAST
jgi:UDP-N-acetylglucosamine 2-epimerase (non-hydrolysing)